jgi:hypothetical protein
MLGSLWARSETSMTSLNTPQLGFALGVFGGQSQHKYVTLLYTLHSCATSHLTIILSTATMGPPSNPPRSSSPGLDRGDGDGDGNGDDGANQSFPHASADDSAENNSHPDAASVLSSGRSGGTNDNSHRQQQRQHSIGDRRAPPPSTAARAQAQQKPSHPPPPPPPPPSQVLRVQFGSNLHQTYNANPISYREVIVAPALLGHENNSTNFADLREDFERIIRDGRNEGPKWTLNKLLRPSTVTMLAEAASGDGRPMNGAYRQSTAVMHVVRTACAYYSVDEPSAHVRVSYRKGQPPCLYGAHANARCVTGEADEARQTTSSLLTAAYLSTVLFFLLPHKRFALCCATAGAEDTT